MFGPVSHKQMHRTLVARHLDMPSVSAVARKYSGEGGRYCSSCRSSKEPLFTHPIFQIPLCEACNENYHSGEFVVEDGNEIYCRWCGQGEEGKLFLCDTCPKSFCIRCVRTNFGIGEVERIKNLSHRWCCFVCSPQSFRDFCAKHGWKGITKEASDSMAHRSRQPGIINYDISRGREKFEIPAINTVDKEPAPLDFIYVNKPVAGEGIRLTNNPNFLPCCSCIDDCSNPLTCECIINSGGPSYDHAGRLLVDRPAGIYECNYRCSCHVKLCQNRVVSNGPVQRLEVFRCSDPNKGWGVRCKDPLPPGTYIADYIGEIMAEKEADRRGLSESDEYLYSLDVWGRSQACQRLHELGLKRSIESIPREYFVDSTHLTRKKLEFYFDDGDQDKEFLDFLEKKGKIASMNNQQLQIQNHAPWMLLRAAGVSHENIRNSYLQLKSFNAKASLQASVNSSSASSATSSKLHPESLETFLASLESEESQSSNNSIIDTANNYNHSLANGWKEYCQFIDSIPNMPINPTSKKSKRPENNLFSQDGDVDDNAVTISSLKRQRLSWYDIRLKLRQKAWNDARAIVVDRCINEADERNESFIIDARWYGSVGRFFNHSCAPNMDKILVYCDTHDVTVPRVGFFTNDSIPANTELCYDYGYFAGNVAGRHKVCLCGAENCRKTWY